MTMTRVRMSHDYWTALNALGRAAIDYAVEIVRVDDGTRRVETHAAVIERLQSLAHLAISFAMQGAIELEHDATKIRELERQLVATLNDEAAHETS
jgi:ribosomal protein S3AE